jgi:hypothetical protein
MIRENIKISAKESLGYYELRKHKPWFDEENKPNCSGSRHFRNKKREYLKEKINELERNSKNKNIRDLYR